jgi:hypothetical protein
MDIIFGVPIYKSHLQNNKELQLITDSLIERMLCDNIKSPKWSCDVYTTHSNEEDEINWDPFVKSYHEAFNAILDENRIFFKGEVNINYGKPWVNIYSTPKQFQERHDHLPEDMSMIHFLHFNKTHSQTEFYSPLRSFGHGVKFKSILPGLKEQYASKIKLDAQEGDVFFFPSYLEHAVPFSDGIKGNRVTISLNINFTKLG